jgi:hypothetical protein
MLQIFTSANLAHEAVFVSVHSSQLTHMVEGVLESIGKLIRVDVGQTKLYVRIYNKLCQT